MKCDTEAQTDNLFNQLKWVDENTLQGQKKPKKYDTRTTMVYEKKIIYLNTPETIRVYQKKFVYRNIPFDFSVAEWRDKDGKIMRGVKSDFDWFKGAFKFTMYLRGEMTDKSDKETWLRYNCYEYLPGKENCQTTLKEMARGKLDRTIEEIDWYLDAAAFELPRESFRLIQQLRKVKKPMPKEHWRKEQTKRFEKKVLMVWDKQGKKAAYIELSYRGIPFMVRLISEVDRKNPEKESEILLFAPIRWYMVDKIPGLRFSCEIYERIYGSMREEITFSRKVPVQEKIAYGIYYTTRFIDWFFSYPEGDILSETATILAEMNKVVKKLPARLECSKV